MPATEPPLPTAPIAPALCLLDPEVARLIDRLCAEHGDDPEDVIADLLALDRDRQAGFVGAEELAPLLAELGAS